MKNTAFDLFRYQILPRNRSFQPDLFGGIKTLEDLLAKKNDFFAECIQTVEKFQSKRSEIVHKLIYHDQESFLFKMAVHRSIKRETEEFVAEELENWPSILVLIWNRPDKQIIAIQERGAAFQKTDVVANTIAETANKVLVNQNLRVHVEALFLEKAFWDLIEEHKGKIKDIKFELITPNMANISETLSEELEDLAKGSNAAQSNLEIIADPDSSIIVEESDNRIRGLVQYSSKGGGDISIKLRGFKGRVHTKESKKRVDVDEVTISGADPKGIVTVLKRLIQ